MNINKLIGILSLCFFCVLTTSATTYNYTSIVCLSATDPYAREPYSYTDANGNTAEWINNGEITIPSIGTNCVIPLTRLGTVNNTPPASGMDYSYEIDYYTYNSPYDGTTQISRTTYGNGDITSITFEDLDVCAKIKIIPYNNGFCDPIRNVSYAFTWPQPILIHTRTFGPDTWNYYLDHCTNIATVYIKDAPENFSVTTVQPTAIEGKSTTCDQNDPNVILFKITKDCPVTSGITLPDDPDDEPGASANTCPYFLSGTAIAGLDYPYPPGASGTGNYLPIGCSARGIATFTGNDAYVVVCPIQDCMTEDSESVVISLPSGTRYLPLGYPPFSTSGTIVDAPNLPPTVSITSPANGTTYYAPATISISANAADDCSVSKVDFYQGNTLLGTVTSAPYTFNWNNVPVGTYTLTATATDNNGASTTSYPITVVVSTIVTNNYCTPPPTNMVSWWRAETNALDSVGPNNGTLVGGTTYAVGEVGQAFKFNAVGDKVTAPTAGFPTGTSDRTMECWVNISSYVSGAEVFFVGYGNFGTSGQTYALGALTDHRLFFSQWGNSVIGPVLNTNQWYHIAVTSVGNNVVTLYLNGVAMASGTLSFNTPAGSQFYIGGVTAPYTTRQLIGQIDEVSVYSRALSAAEIQAIYNAGSAGKCPPTCTPPPTNMVSWWRAETNALDSVGPNNGTLVGGTTYAVGEVGQAFKFNAVGDKVTAPTAGFPTGTSDRTMECWVNISSYISGAEVAFVGYGNLGAGGQAYVLGAIPDHRLFFSQWGEILIGPALNTNQWYHIAVTSVGTNAVTLYLNGVAVASGAVSFNTPAGSQFYIGGVTAPYTTRQLIGRIDEVSVYNRALSAAEIQAIYNAGSAGKCR